MPNAASVGQEVAVFVIVVFAKCSAGPPTAVPGHPGMSGMLLNHRKHYILGYPRTGL